MEKTAQPRYTPDQIRALETREGMFALVDINRAVFTKTSEEKAMLATAKLAYRKTLRAFYGSTWTKRSSNRLNKDGCRRINLRGGYLN
jgi:hypothetical protein